MRRLASAWLGGVLPCAGLALGVALLFSSRAFAVPGVVADSSLGSLVNQTGNNYAITGGTTHGANLFHSFSDFNLTSGQSATFTGATSIQNIIARVTGGPSSIDGTITSNIPNVNLFLLNPAGIMFGADAQVNIGGAFVVGSPDYVKLADGGKFNTSLGDDSNLTSADVSAFGFLPRTSGNFPWPISFAGTRLSVATGQGLHVIGGDITLNQGTVTGGSAARGSVLSAPSGQLTLFSGAGAGETAFSLASPGSGYAHSTVASFGTITMQHKSFVKIDGAGGGNIIVRGGRLVFNNSQISSANSGAAPGGDVSVQADSLTANGSISSTQSLYASVAGIAVTTAKPATGSAGKLTVNLTGDLNLTGGAALKDNTTGAGDAGDIMVTAATVNLSGVFIDSKVNASEIESVTNANLPTALQLPGNSPIYGHAGMVTLVVQDLNINQGAEVTTFTTTNGHAGAINVMVHDTLNIDGAGTNEGDLSTINSVTYGTGAAGAITVNASTINLVNTGRISAASSVTGFGGSKFASNGMGGALMITANNMTIRGAVAAPDGATRSGVFSTTNTPNAAGTITIHVPGTLSIEGGGALSTSCRSTGMPGSITVTAGTLKVDGSFDAPGLLGGTVYSSIRSSQESGNHTPNPSLPAGGTIDLTVGGTLSVSDQGVISTSSDNANAGTITIKAATVKLTSGGNIDTTAAIGGGNIVLNVKDLVFAQDSQIMTFSGVSGGNITIDPQFVILQNSTIDAHAALGQGGDITILTDNFLREDSLLNASGARSGTIDISAPDLDLSGALVTLPAGLGDDASRLRESCARSVNHEFSSFIEVGRGGTESSPTELQADFGMTSD